ncbi:MAG: glycerophosphodiester phosphodiesterase family protein [Ginsengibacter sp.]
MIGFCHLYTIVSSQPSVHLKKTYYLIAHRGGVVDSTITDNSRTSIEAAIKRGYNMVEVDLRLTKDSILIIQHDPTFKRYYGLDKPVSSMTWDQTSQLRSSIGGDRVLRFEDVLKICKGRIQIMIDNKIRGMDSGIFTRVISLVRHYGLLDQALMIGTTASTPFFTGRIKLSCTRKQLEINMKQPGYSPANYYIFEIPGNISARDVKWAKANDIQIVAAINKFRYYHSSDPLKDAREDINRMRNEGVTHFQIDSEFDASFH